MLVSMLLGLCAGRLCWVLKGCLSWAGTLAQLAVVASWSVCMYMSFISVDSLVPVVLTCVVLLPPLRPVLQ